MKLDIKAGATSVSINVFVQDSSSTTGAGLTGLAYNTAGLTAYYALPAAAPVAITLATLAAVTSAYSSGGFKEIDATNMPGWYRLDIPNAALASGRFVNIHLKGATNMAPLPIEIALTGWDNQDGVRGGMTALPNAAAEAAGGLYTRGSGAGQIAQDANGRINSNTAAWNGTTIPGVDTAGYPKVTIKSGSGAGELSISGGRVAIQARLQKNATGGLRVPFQMTDSTNHNPATGKTVTLTRSLNGAAFGAGTIGTVTEISGGWYWADFAQADINGDTVLINADASGCDTTPILLFMEP